jgi:two-component system, OmpR family, response regulator
VRILVVEDAPKVAELLARGLREDGFAVDIGRCCADAVWLATEHEYDAIVLDVMLGDGDGFDVVRTLRDRQRWAPVLMLTARDGIEDRVRGLDAGADDYLTKPFAFVELLARVRALVRRGVQPRPVVLRVGDLVLDPASRAVSRGDALVGLTAKEFSLLELLMRRATAVVTRDELFMHGWDFAFDGDPHVLTVTIANLREKIDRPFGRSSLQTVRAIGYRIVDDLAGAAR